MIISSEDMSNNPDYVIRILKKCMLESGHSLEAFENDENDIRCNKCNATIRDLFTKTNLADAMEFIDLSCKEWVIKKLLE